MGARGTLSAPILSKDFALTFVLVSSAMGRVVAAPPAVRIGEELCYAADWSPD